MAEIKLLSKEKKKYKITVDVGSKGTRQRKSCIFFFRRNSKSNDRRFE